MRVTYLFALFLLLAAAVAAQDTRKTSGVRYIEEYECGDACVADPKHADRRLVRLSGYDRSGREVLRYEISNLDGKGMRWTRHVFTYDLRGNTIGDLEFESTALGQGQYFTIDHADKEPKVIPEVTERETNTAIFTYDERDHEVEARFTDEHHNLVRLWECAFDGHGREVAGRSTEKGVVTIERRTVYSPDGRSSVQTQTDGNKRSTTSTSYDEKGRTILSETFNLPPSGAASPLQSRVIARRESYTYNGDLTSNDVVDFDEKGLPLDRSIVVCRGEDEILVSITNFAPKSDGGKFYWVLAQEMQFDRSYDSHGELIKEVQRDRLSADGPFKIDSFREMVATY